MNSFKRLACVCLTAVMSVSLAAGNALAFANGGKNGDGETAYGSVSHKDVTGKVDLSSVAVKNLSGAVMNADEKFTEKNGKYTVIVGLDENGLLADKPQDLSVSEYAMTRAGSRTVGAVENQQESFLNALSLKGIGYKLKAKYNAVANAVALQVAAYDIDKISAMPGVQSVVLSSSYEAPKAAETDSNGGVLNYSYVYETGIYKSQEWVDKGYDGSGVTVAILDTGLDYTHAAFQNMPSKISLNKASVEKKLASVSGGFSAVKLSAAEGSVITADDLWVNEKVPFAYDYADKDADVYPSYSQHGTHVAGIVGGQADSYTDADGNLAQKENEQTGELENIPFRGVAPQSQLVICKVFTDDLESKDLGGATTEDILAALDDCVKLGVDIINMSLGTSAGFSSIEIDGDTEGAWMNRVYTEIKKAGINLIAAASNEFSAGYGSAFGTNLTSNPDSGTVGSPSTFNGALSVASVNGQLTRYMTVGGKPIYYEDSSDANSVRRDFLKGMLGYDEENKKFLSERGEFKYVVIGGKGEPADYSKTVLDKISKLKEQGHKVIVLVQRGSSTFKDKIALAMRLTNPAAVIIRNNVAGGLRVSVGDIDNPVPVASINMEAGNALVKAAVNGIGDIVLDTSYQAGPFMNDYSSWGVTPDLQLKPDVTSHGGEIISTVAGGYAEMSGTSMAAPNLAGFAALLRGYLKDEKGITDSTQLTRISNQLMMSTATTVYDYDGNPYSPRKQGSGLATLENVFSTGAYLYTDINQVNEQDDINDWRDGRPKAELGEDEQKKGVYSFYFYVKNAFGDKDLSFNLQSIFFTESVSPDGLAVAEKAYLLNSNAKWKVDGKDADKVTVAPGKSAKISVTLTLTAEEKKYLNDRFENGMFVEGFIKLLSSVEGQCDLTLPFMGFYGDWEQAPMLDYDCFEMSDFEKDKTLTDETRPKAQVWATQPYATYYNETYYVPMGGFLYVQDENAEQIYVDRDHLAVSRYNEYQGEESLSNYMTTTGIKTLYAGLLRNAELVTYDMYDALTGEIVKSDEIYRINKAYAGSGSAVPAQVKLDLSPVDLGLTSNGKYTIDFKFYFNEEDRDDPLKQNNTFSMTFYVDYEAPVLMDSRLRFYDYKENGKDKQKVYLDLDVFDNHYAQSVLFCYSDKGSTSDLKMVTEYVTPVYNAVKNGTTTVSIDITHLYSDKNAMSKYDYYVQLDDYALNHTVLQLNFDQAGQNPTPADFTIAENDRITAVEGSADKQITLSVNELYKVGLDYEGTANLSNFKWECRSTGNVVVKNGEIFAIAATRMPVTVSVSNGKGVVRNLRVTVKEGSTRLPQPTLSFGDIEDATQNLVKASGSVEVAAGSSFDLTIQFDPWYYNEVNSLKNGLKFKWENENPAVAEIDTSATGAVNTVHIGNAKGTTSIKATLLDANGKPTSARASVTLVVPDPFRVSNFTLTYFSGNEETVIIPDDKNIMTIGDRAFYKNDTMKKVIIPKTVTTISERAFDECTALEEVYFIQEEAKTPADSSLSMIRRYAFRGCKNLKKVDLSNVKIITLDRNVFEGCSSLETVVAMNKIGTMGNRTFADCTSLSSIDISGLHLAGNDVFAGCTSLKTVKADYYTDLGEGMFYKCTGLESVTISSPIIKAGADYGEGLAHGVFAGCTSLKTVNFKTDSNYGNYAFNIGAYAFLNCTSLETVNFNGSKVSKIGDMAFSGCSLLSDIEIFTDADYGDSVFKDTKVTFDEAFYDGTTLVLAPSKIPAGFAIKEGTTKIAPYAFAGSQFADKTLYIPDSVTEIGEGAFAHTTLETITHFSKNVTKIADYTFFDSMLKGVEIPAQVTEIGNGAFSGCYYLESIDFAADSKLKVLGDNVFANVRMCKKVTLPASLEIIGDGTFFNDGVDSVSGTLYESALEEVTFPSVKTLGSSTFYGCTRLTTVIFGDNATTVGDTTFYPGHVYVTDGTNINVKVLESKLTSVTLGSGITKIGLRAFQYCSALTSINLNNVTIIEDEAFAGCSSLKTVEGLERVTDIGAMAFADAAITSLNLSSAQRIGNSAFFISSGAQAPVEQPYTSVKLGNALKSIGISAFFGGGEREINVPASVEYIGEAAFASSKNLVSVTVDNGNKNYFSKDGVLYRNVKDFLTGKNNYELVAYPANKDSVSVYEVLEDTVSIAESAFRGLNASAIGEVVLPYSLKVIGIAAFYESGITVYNFKGITAPALNCDYYDNSIVNVPYFYLYYNNFAEEFPLFIGSVNGYAPAELTIKYPKNARGFDNFIYDGYFANKIVGDEVAGETVREIIELVSGFETLETVNGWLSADVNAETTKTVVNLSERVKKAHSLYLKLNSQSQLALPETVAAFEKITAMEAALKPVKERFGIAVSPVKLELAADNSVKTQYVAGEKFDINGLKLNVVYDDYSTVAADADKIRLTAEFADKVLSQYDLFVTVEGYGLTININITVSENANGAVPPQSEGGCNGGCSSQVSVIGGVVVLAAVAGFVLIRKFSSKKHGED